MLPPLLLLLRYHWRRFITATDRARSYSEIDGIRAFRRTSCNPWPPHWHFRLRMFCAIGSPAGYNPA